MRSFFGRLGVALAIFALGCSIEHPTQRDAGACGISGTPCCRFDAGIRLDASGLMSNGCANGLSCVSGTCQACPSGQRLCNGVCVSVTDNNHCGACGNVCTVGFTCMTGSGDAGTPSCERVCPPGQNRCGAGNMSICTDLNMDTANCGTCGTSCAARMLPNVATPACTAGMCTVGVCSPNFANCDMSAANGCEVNTQTSNDHCGGCGRQCATPPNAMPVCRGGTCDFTCLPGFSDCDRNPNNGCETNLNTDPRNCMMCGRGCPTQPGQTATCSGGTCGFTMTLMCPTGTGNCDMNAANGCETNTVSGVPNMSQIDHCGACGTTCNFPFAAARCLGGTCAMGVCSAGRANCDGDEQNGCEVILATNSSNCGACGAFCPRANNVPTCVAGVCQLGSCLTNFANCDGNAANGCEVDVRSSAQHCGRCGNACGAGQQCLPNAMGVPTCTLVCPTGQRDCGGRCVDTNTDLANCGGCMRPCAMGQVCTNGACALSCAVGQTICSGACRDLTSDRLHCGACGNVCGAGQVCENSVCRLSCPTGQTACSGTCRDLTNDAANCGACNTSCAGRFANSTPTCTSSACVLGACTGTFANCDGNAMNGCETNVSNTVTNCGACGNACSFANASATCSSGRCALGTCNSGFGNCDGIAENGCETNLNTAVNHCGTCGTVCSTSTPGLVPVCNARVCGTALGMCPTGFADCNAAAGDGCEVNTTNTLAHCGGCGQACNRANAAESCTGGVCLLGACETGFGNCDGDAVNGCETNTRTSTTHCGGCGRPCFFANATATCTSGACGLGTCETGFANCDNNATNGCEASLQSDRNNCGTCGRQCAAGEVCSGGSCTLSCQAGLNNCGGSCANLLTDRANCGACGTTCAAGRICQNGACVLSCPAGQTACGASCVNTQTDSANCGACSNPCTGGRVCTGGMCVCPAGQTLCGGVCVDTLSSPTHCSPMNQCNMSCAVNQVCSNGACVTTCSGGLTNCSGACVNTTTSLANCGACGNACSLANATNSCSGGNCGISSCNSGFANCNNTTGDGCEVNITTSATNCNGCNNNCNTLPGVASAMCVASACANLVCTSGLRDCNNNTNDGCESTSATDVSNCGTCGNDCNDLPQVATSTCGSGMCSVSTCDTNFGNCDSMSSNGCETDLRNSVTNCSACGASCPGGGANNTVNNTCLAGRCNCAAGFRDCDTNRANGCESNRFSDPNNCGECGVVCSGATPQCVFGTCQAAGCGANGQACCTGNVCGANLACVSGNCTSTCGGQNEPCCSGNTCSGPRTCSSGTCT